jgi:choline-sulfatase
MLNRRDFIKLLSLMALAGSKRVALQNLLDDNRTDTNSPNILILLFDTMSALHLSSYGYRRDTTPNITRFAGKSTVYHNHYAAGNFTTPGTASILTGTYPWTHRALHLQGTTHKNFVSRNLFASFNASEYTRIGLSHNYMVNILLDQFVQGLDHFIFPNQFVLKDNNFSDNLFPKDYIVASRSEGAYLGKEEGFPSSIFTIYFLSLLRHLNRMNAKASLEKNFPRGVPGWHDMIYPLEMTMDWIMDTIPSFPKPFLSYIHLMPPHHPYRPSSEFVGIFQDGWTPKEKPVHPFQEGRTVEFLVEKRMHYDEYMAYVDSEFGRLIDFLGFVGLLDNTWIFLTSDHGEMFERGIWQHTTPVLYEPIIRVPLLIYEPGQNSRNDIHVPSSCVDLLPTIMNLKRQPVPNWCEGRVLPPFCTSAGMDDRSVFVIEAKSNPKRRPLEKGTIAMIKGKYKLIWYFGYKGFEDTFEMYDLENDPEELNDIASLRSSLAHELQHELVRKLEEVNKPYSQ